MISPDEKLNRLEKEYPGLMAIIWYLSNNINKLNREFIDKSLGNRTSLEQYAKIENIPLSDLLDYLHISTGNLHELKEEKKHAKENISAENGGRPVFLKNIKEGDLIELDVRRDILSGIDPINSIKEAVSRLTGSNALCLINIFEPVPLYFALGKKGIKHWTEYKNNCWFVYFYKESSVN